VVESERLEKTERGRYSHRVAPRRHLAKCRPEPRRRPQHSQRRTKGAAVRTATHIGIATRWLRTPGRGLRPESCTNDHRHRHCDFVDDVDDQGFDAPVDERPTTSALRQWSPRARIDADLLSWTNGHRHRHCDWITSFTARAQSWTLDERPHTSALRRLVHPDHVANAFALTSGHTHTSALRQQY
jgi:hypothetical protein